MLRKAEIRRIYEQGVEAVTATIGQLYQMIEAEDERVYKLVASATAAHLKNIDELTSRITRLEAELVGRRRQIYQLHLFISFTSRLKNSISKYFTSSSPSKTSISN